MKIVSWNLNGLRSAWDQGLKDFLEDAQADVYAFQETKVNEPFSPIELDGYHSFWSFCSRAGYSGTLCLSREKPLAVYKDFALDGEEGGEPFDYEGRTITLEFPNLYLVNVYVPNSQRTSERKEYRMRWDERFLKYASQLMKKKPTVICGDFNGTIENEDIYPESIWVERNSEGYMSVEREDLRRLVAMGYDDSYRLVHPDEQGRYSWWSQRRRRRDVNHGWRLDYIFTSAFCKPFVDESTMLTDVLGSDHCPLVLEMDLPEPREDDVEKTDPNDKTAPIHDGSFYDRFLSSENLGRYWDKLDWPSLETSVARRQYEIAKAAYAHDKPAILRKQRILEHYLPAALLAVRHAASMKSHHLGPGHDNEWRTSDQKMAAALRLVNGNFEVKPSNLIVMKTKNGKYRRIQVQEPMDRAVQALYAMALDPASEALADLNSFAFRKGRSMQDLNEAIKLAFSRNAFVRRYRGKFPVEWRNGCDFAFIGDVHQCYERVSHSWVIEHIPLSKQMLKQFLKAGYLFGGECFPSEVGVGLGLSLSPIIANMTLDGMQEFIYRHLNPKAYVQDRTGRYERLPDVDIDFANGNLVRYADDFIVATRDRKTAVEIRELMKEFLRERGLELSETKCRIVDIREGFDFMSRHYVKEDGYVYSSPSDASVDRFMEELRDYVETFKGSQEKLIDGLNKKLSGFATYHKTGDAASAFSIIDYYLNALLLNHTCERHSHWKRDKVIEHYWYKLSDGRLCFALPDRKEKRVIFLSDIVLVKHRQVNVYMNPYTDGDYLATRKSKREQEHVTGSCKAIWERQGGRCFYCGKPILKDQEQTLTEVDPYASKRTDRMAYVHMRCLVSDVTFVDEGEMSGAGDRILVENAYGKSERMTKKFLPLGDFFQHSNDQLITLSFEMIGKILGTPLGKMSKRKQFWTTTGDRHISWCWVENGYTIEKLDLENEVVRFRKLKTQTSSVTIPEVFLHSRVPNEAKLEFENHCRYLINKYGL